MPPSGQARQTEPGPRWLLGPSASINSGEAAEHEDVACLPAPEEGRPELEGARRGHLFLFWLSPPPAISPQILIPALMVTAEKDRVLVPEMSKHMEDWVRTVLPGSSVLPGGRGQVSPRKEAAKGRGGHSPDTLAARGLPQEPHCHLLGATTVPDASFSLHGCSLSFIHSLIHLFISRACAVPLNVLGSG